MKGQNQLLIYAENFNLLGMSMNTTRNKAEILLQTSTETVLQV
jgi:hypothetical protein